ncbi:MAG: VCBS repeat-containing protein, partial [Lentisphaeria bacterium]|nr:VCBS repeat-containing protein [Lentisphaeria bacterium]
MMKSAMLLLFCGALGTATAAPFENVTAAMNLTGQSMQSAAWGDFDNDGFVDLFSSAVFRNEGGESFKNVAALPPHVSVADYNGDGFLDVAGVGEAIPTITLLSYNGETGKWDDNSAAFEKVPTYRPYSSFWADFNGDGMVEVIMGCKNRIYRNLGEGRFKAEPLCPKFNEIVFNVTLE